MPVKRLNIKNPKKGTPRQAVPTRVIPAILGISPERAISLIADDEYMGQLLCGYELTTGRHKKRKITAKQAEQLISQINSKKTEIAKIRAIPKGHFVWSDELIEAIIAQHMVASGPEAVADQLKNTTWNPSLGAIKPLIGECPDLAKILKPTKYEVDCKYRNDQIKEKGRELFDADMNPRNIPSTIAGTVEFEDLRNGNPLETKQIKRIMDKELKQWKIKLNKMRMSTSGN